MSVRDYGYTCAVRTLLRQGPGSGRGRLRRPAPVPPTGDRLANRQQFRPFGVVDGETGLLVPPGDVASLTRAMQELIDQPQRRQRLGQAGRERAKPFRPDAVLPRFEALYQQVVAG